jgi:drug/metabolite transporter (DMT)-like permease
MSAKDRVQTPAADYTGSAHAGAAASGAVPAEPRIIALCALLTGALVWGVVWYPYRALRDAGVGGEFATAATYVIAMALAVAGYWRHMPAWRPRPMLLAIAVTSGGCNVGFVLASIHGHVVRVVLLFYLAPVWTVIFAFVLLGERLSRQGVALMVLALSGAIIMLWNPALGMPVPADGWEWAALAAGVLFALSTVLIRRARDYSIEHKSFSVFAGCALIGAAVCLLSPGAIPESEAVGSEALLLLALIGVTVFAVNYAVQYGLAQVSANQAMMVYLSELVFAALSSWLLAGEVLTAKEWTGGVMIVAASMLSGRLQPAANAAVT